METSPSILVSAGEASGDRYAAGVVQALRRLHPNLRFFGCAGVEMRAEGVETIVETESLSVVGLVEVLHHIPRIYGEFRKLVHAARQRRPAAAILTDSPDFHLRLAAQLRALAVPVFYLVAPQVWAWREGRVRAIRRNVTELHCIFPFEEQWFRERGVDAFYIGHPLARHIRPTMSRAEFFLRHGLALDRPLVTLCPGSRRGEAARHLPALEDAIGILRERANPQFVLASPASSANREEWRFLDGFCAKTGTARICGETWDAMAHADVTLPASGTVTVEAALLQAPMVTYYKVTAATWGLGQMLVKVPYYSMVNLIAGSRVVPELMQHEMTGPNLARETCALLENKDKRSQMIAGLNRVREALATGQDPLAVSASRIHACLAASEGKEEV